MITQLDKFNRDRETYQVVSMARALKSYKWQARSASIYDKTTGRRIYTDLLVHFSQPKKLPWSAMVAKSDGYAYLSIARKKYRVALA